jgi:hypothetical protein
MYLGLLWPNEIIHGSRNNNSYRDVLYFMGMSNVPSIVKLLFTECPCVCGLCVAVFGTYLAWARNCRLQMHL